MTLSPDELAIIPPASEFKHHQTIYLARTQEAYDRLPEKAGWQVHTHTTEDGAIMEWKERLPLTQGWITVHQPVESWR